MNDDTKAETHTIKIIAMPSCSVLCQEIEEKYDISVREPRHDADPLRVEIQNKTKIVS